jgi:hypothetical protein
MPSGAPYQYPIVLRCGLQVALALQNQFFLVGPGGIVQETNLRFQNNSYESVAEVLSNLRDIGQG